MKIVAIVAEYNPFHYGHLHQITEIRKQYGLDTAIVAVMSGNFTQRGELTIADKVTRARCAVLSGVNLVLELPFPYSSSSAEFFARSAVSIIHSLGVCDILSFGSECGSLSALMEAHSRISSDEFINQRNVILAENKGLGYPLACELAYHTLYGNQGISFTPNNILALMYLDALHTLGAQIEPHTVARVGQGYNETSLGESYSSATAIRAALYENNREALSQIPSPAREIFQSGIDVGNALPSYEHLYSAVIHQLLLNTSSDISIHDGEDGLYNRISSNARNAKSISDLITLSETKKYTRARVRRVILNSLLGVTSSNVRTLPKFTQLLASDSLGLAILKQAKNKANIVILTKPSRYSEDNPLLKEQIEMSHHMDMFYMMALGGGHVPADALTFTPFIKKD